MGSHDLKREVEALLKEAAHAAEHAEDNLLNRADLQRLIARLRRTLSRLNRAHDELEVVYRALTEGLCR